MDSLELLPRPPHTFPALTLPPPLFNPFLRHPRPRPRLPVLALLPFQQAVPVDDRFCFLMMSGPVNAKNFIDFSSAEQSRALSSSSSSSRRPTRKNRLDGRGTASSYVTSTVPMNGRCRPPRYAFRSERLVSRTSEYSDLFRRRYKFRETERETSLGFLYGSGKSDVRSAGMVIFRVAPDSPVGLFVKL